MRQKLLVLFCFSLFLWTGVFAQNMTVSGTVKNDQGEPIPAASVKLKGTNVGAIAGPEGDFKINAKKGDYLIISALQYQTSEVRVTGEHIDVVLKPTTGVGGEDNGLSDVIVTALGIKREARSTGYSTQSVNTADMTQAKVTNIANGLSGKIAGLQINTVNNGVNPATRIVLRGERSILGNNQALIVLDNLPISSGFLNSLNPDDIKTTTVLKGANAAALYGSQAANGVIMLTSNMGSTKGPKIGFSHTTTIEKVSFFPKLQDRFGAASTEGDFKDPLTGYFPHVPFENQQYGGEYNGMTYPLGVPVRYTNAAGQVVDTMQSVVYSNKNAIKSFFNTGITNQDALSYSNGDENGTFYLSGQYVNTSGTIPDDKSNRTTVRMAGTRHYGRFDASASASYTRFNSNVAGADYNQGRPVYWNVLNTPGEIDITKYKDPNFLFSDESNFYNAYYPNPYWQVLNSRVISQRDDFLGSAELNFTAADWAKFTYRIGIATSNTQSKTTIGGVTFSDYAISDPAGASNAASGFPNGVKPQEGDNLGIYSTIQSDLLGTFNKDFMQGDLQTTLIVGGSVNKERTRSVSIGMNQMEIPELYNVSNTIGVPLVGESLVQTGKFGLYGDLQLSYKNYLFLEATGRNDWVSVLDPKNRSFFYPSINGSFVFTDAFKGIRNALPWLDFGKLTASWTKVGTVSIGAYALSNTFGQTSGFPYGSLTGFALGTNLANSDIKPEFTKSTEFGLHLAMFKSRVNADVNYYTQSVTNQTIPISISSATGYLSTTQNVGLLKNSGWEFVLDATPLLNLGPVQWDMKGNLSLMQSKIESILPGVLDRIFIGGYDAGSVYSIAGKPIRELLVTDWKRDPQGRVIVDPNTGYPTADPTLKDAGRATPSTILGLNTSFKYKGWRLGIVGEYRGGYNVFQFIGNAMAFTGTSAITAVDGRGKFVFPNSVINTGTADNPVYTPNTDVVIQDGATGSGFWASKYNTVGSPYVVSGAFWKIREVSLDYDIPLKNTNVIKSLTVGVVARNLLTFLPKDNPYADPEYSQFGTGNAQAVSNENLSPPTRIFGGTLSIVF